MTLEVRFSFNLDLKCARLYEIKISRSIIAKISRETSIAAFHVYGGGPSCMLCLDLRQVKRMPRGCPQFERIRNNLKHRSIKDHNMEIVYARAHPF